MATRNGHFNFMFLPDQIKLIPNSMIVLGEHFWLMVIAGADPGFRVGGGPKPPGGANIWFLPYFSKKKCMKMREFLGCREGCALRSPPRSANKLVCFIVTKILKYFLNYLIGQLSEIDQSAFLLIVAKYYLLKDCRKNATSWQQFLVPPPSSPPPFYHCDSWMKSGSGTKNYR